MAFELWYHGTILKHYITSYSSQMLLWTQYNNERFICVDKIHTIDKQKY